MKITATLNGASVTIVEVNVNGDEIYITYVDSSNNINTTRAFFNHQTSATVIATGATIN